MRPTLPLALASAILLANPAFAQTDTPQVAVPTAQSQPYTLKVTAQTVVLDVVVTDKKGNIVPNLTSGDFQVFEDKVPQTVRTLESSVTERPTTPLKIESTAQLDKEAPQAPVNIIILDEINTLFEDEAFARYSLKQYLKTQTDTLPQPTMLVAVTLDKFMVLQDFTTSKSQILTALDHHLVAYPWHVINGSRKGEQFNAAFNSLIEIAEATAGHPGHKSMIWVGRGFPSMDPMTMPPDLAESIKSAVEACTNALRDARVVLYTLDPAGISAAGPDTSSDPTSFYENDPFNANIDFNIMARATGGHAFHGRNDVDNLIAASERDGNQFYTLSYVPVTQTEPAISPDGQPKTFRNIRIVMRDPNLRATTRAGYYTPIDTGDAAAKAPTQPNGSLSGRLVFDLSVAGQSLMVYDAVPITITRDAGSPDRFILQMSTANIPWKQVDPQHLSTSVAVMVESFDRKGKLLDHTSRIHNLQIPAAATDLTPAQPTFAVTETIPTQPPAARLRFVVRLNENGKIGADNVYLVDKKTLADPTTGLHPTR